MQVVGAPAPMGHWCVRLDASAVAGLAEGAADTPQCPAIHPCESVLRLQDRFQRELRRYESDVCRTHEEAMHAAELACAHLVASEVADSQEEVSTTESWANIMQVGDGTWLTLLSCGVSITCFTIRFCLICLSCVPTACIHINVHPCYMCVVVLRWVGVVVRAGKGGRGSGIG